MPDNTAEDNVIESSVGVPGEEPLCPYGHRGSVFYLNGWRCWKCGVRIVKIPGVRIE